MATQKETPANVAEERQARQARLNEQVNELTARVLDLEKELRQARADERRARAALARG